MRRQERSCSIEVSDVFMTSLDNYVVTCSLARSIGDNLVGRVLRVSDGDDDDDDGGDDVDNDENDGIWRLSWMAWASSDGLLDR